MTPLSAEDDGDEEGCAQQAGKDTDGKLAGTCAAGQNIGATQENTAQKPAKEHRAKAVVFGQQAGAVGRQQADETDQAREADDGIS